MENKAAKCRVVVLIGGSGSNLQALIDQSLTPSSTVNIAGVISHRPQAYGLVRAQQAAIPTAIIDHQLYESREPFEKDLITCIKGFTPDLIVLAGFMRILSPLFAEHFGGQLLNIHPSLLPKFKGLNTHARALAAQETTHGASVHFVTAELDSGPLIAQIQVPVLPEDDATLLAQRVLKAEHWLYPQVIEWYAQKRLKWQDNTVFLDGKPLDPHGVQFTLPTLQGIVN